MAGLPMSITFPNRSRSYDDSERRVRFTGHDGVFEVKFFIGIDTLAKAVAAKLATEKEALSAFDGLRKRILEAAEKVYGRSKRGNMFILTSADI
jgi:hypothetical protein